MQLLFITQTNNHRRTIQSAATIVSPCRIFSW